MNRRRRRQVVAVLALLFVGFLWWLSTERAGKLACAEIRERAPALLHASVEIGRCSVDPLNAGVRLERVQVKTEKGELELGADEAAVSMRGLFFGGLSFHDIALVRPVVRVNVPAPNDKPAATAGLGCPLEKLKAIRIDQLKIEDGRVTIVAPNATTHVLEGVELTSSLGRGGADIELSIRSARAELGNQRAISVDRVSLDAHVNVESQAVELRRLEVSGEGVTTSLTGELSALCEADPSAAVHGQLFVPLQSVGRVIGKEGLTLGGQVWGRVSAQGRLSSLVTRLEIEASKITVNDTFRPGDFSLSARLAGQRLTIDAFTTKSGDGKVTVSGFIERGKTVDAQLHVVTENASFARIMERAGVPGAWVEFPASVEGDVSGTVWPELKLDGPIQFKTGRFSLATRAFTAPTTTGKQILAFSQAEGEFKFGVRRDRVTFDDIALRVGKTSATKVSGTTSILFSPPGIEVEAHATEIDLSDFGAIAELPWAGVGQVDIRVGGPFKDIRIDGLASLRDFKLAGYSLGVVQSPVEYRAQLLNFPTIAAQKGRTRFYGDVSLLFSDELFTRASVQVPEGRVEDVVDVLVDLSPTIQNVQGPLTGKLSGLMELESPGSMLTGLMVFRATDVAYYGRRLGDGPLIARFVDGKALTVDPTTLRGPLGATSLDGTWTFSGPLDFRAALVDGSLTEIADPTWKVPLKGAVNASAVISGSTDVLHVEGSVQTKAIELSGRQMGTSDLKLSLLGPDLLVSGTVVDNLKGQLSSAIRADWPYRAQFQFALPDAMRLYPSGLADVSVATSGTLDANGALKDVMSSQLAFHGASLEVRRGDVVVRNRSPVEVTYHKGSLGISSLELEGPTTTLSAQGRWGPTTTDLRVRGSLDARLLSTVVPDVEKAAGAVELTGAFSGPISAPSLLGSAEMHDVRFVLKGKDVTIRNMSGHADFSERRAVIQDVNAFINDGRLKVRGDVQLDKLKISQVQLQADIEDASFRLVANTPATLTGSALLASRDGDSFQVTGSFDVVKFRYTDPLTLETFLARAKAKLVTSDAQPKEWLHYDIDVVAGNDVRIDNDLARVRLLGKVKLAGTNVKPVLLGAVEVGEGAEGTFRGNQFSIGRGVVQFNGASPTFDLSAQSRVRDYLVTVKAFGAFDDPKVLFLSEPALSETDIVTLLYTGITSKDALTTSTGASLAAEAILSASGLDQQLQRFLSKNVGLKDQQLRLTTSFNEVSGTSEPSVSWEAKVGADNLKIGVTQPVTGVSGTKAQIEYRFSPRASLRGQWNQNQNTTVGNPGAELRFRFEWE